MGKITFRADDDLVAELEAFEASKSEVMREALRAYLDQREPRRTSIQRQETSPQQTPGDQLDALLDSKIETVLADRLQPSPQDVNVTISLEGVSGKLDASAGAGVEETQAQTDHQSSPADVRKTDVGRPDTATDSRSCGQCGNSVAAEHVFCPNCGEKASRRVFCECGDEVRSDWSFCPGCGRRTPAADVLDSSGQ